MYGQREKLPLAEEALDMNGVPSHSIYRHTVISFGVAVLSREANFPLSLTGKGAGSLAMLVQTRTTGAKSAATRPSSFSCVTLLSSTFVWNSASFNPNDRELSDISPTFVLSKWHISRSAPHIY
jgi:hypothetical protein